MMKYIFITFILFLISCNSSKQNNYKKCPQEISQKGYCDMYNEAIWCFYSSNSHGRFEYLDTLTKKIIVLPDILSVDLKLFEWNEKQDTIEFIITTDRKYDLENIKQKIRFSKFGFSKKNRHLIYRSPGNIKLKNSDKSNGYVFYTGDKIYNFIDSTYKTNNILSPDMREYGLYPINEQDSILENKINSNRRDINTWLIEYIKTKGLK